MGLKMGVFHVECKYTSRGPRLIEVNCRMGGGPVRWVAGRLRAAPPGHASPSPGRCVTARLAADQPRAFGGLWVVRCRCNVAQHPAPQTHGAPSLAPRCSHPRAAYLLQSGIEGLTPPPPPPLCRDTNLLVWGVDLVEEHLLVRWEPQPELEA